MTELNPKFRTFVSIKEQNSKLEWDLLDQQNCSYPYSDKIRITKQLIDNIEFIKDKNILDLGTHTGIFLDAMCQLGCKSVLGTNIRKDVNDLLIHALEKAGHQNAKTVLHDIYDLATLKVLLCGIDTIHLSGLIYHIQNHFELLWTLTNFSSANALIIDTICWLPNWYETEPKITFMFEDSSNPLNAVDSKITQEKAYVGVPNLKWYIDVLPLLGWKIKNVDNINYLGFIGNVGKVRRRAVITVCR